MEKVTLREGGVFCSCSLTFLFSQYAGLNASQKHGWQQEKVPLNKFLVFIDFPIHSVYVKAKFFINTAGESKVNGLFMLERSFTFPFSVVVS